MILWDLNDFFDPVQIDHENHGLDYFRARCCGKSGVDFWVLKNLDYKTLADDA